MTDKNDLPHNTNSWNIWKELILSDLKELKVDQKTMLVDIVTIKTEMATLKVKSGIWGALAGLIPVILFLMGWIVLK